MHLLKKQGAYQVANSLLSPTILVSRTIVFTEQEAILVAIVGSEWSSKIGMGIQVLERTPKAF